MKRDFRGNFTVRGRSIAGYATDETREIHRKDPSWGWKESSLSALTYNSC